MKKVIEELKKLSGGDYELNATKRQVLVDRLVEEFGWTSYKVNLPEDNKGWKNGNGEGVWTLVQDPNTKEERFDAIIQNNSVYYWGIITWGCVITAVNRGDNRPVIDWCEEGEHPNLAWMEN